MIKTINTKYITDIMLEAQNVIDGTTTYSDPLSFKDAADIFIAMTEAAPAVEPAQAVEPLDAPHPDYAEYITFEGATRIVISPDEYEQLYNAATRRAPPAIDAETKRMVLEQTNTKTVEPVQAVPAFWASENILKDSLRDNISCILTTTKCAANTVPLYTVPPAIDETRHRLILVCEYLETVGLMFVSPRVISSQIRAILEAGNGE